MSRATLHFDLPEENEEFAVAVNASKMAAQLDDIQAYLRKLDRYDEREDIPIDEIRTYIMDLILDY